MKTAAQLAAYVLFSGVCMAQPSERELRRSKLNYVLQCRGVTAASTSLKQGGPQAITQKSTDEFRLERRGKLLEVQTNVAQYRSMDQQARKILEKPDQYRIVAETGEGFVAVFLNGTTTLHTLTIDRSLSYGIWSESGFSFLPPQSEPTSYTAYLTCKTEKE